ncbi:dendrin [Tiliqua scincoides]|uniref:dendrin n=1 Tax=Tiliqua scincoides TaxID=71010 RepID=UPI003462B1BD
MFECPGLSPGDARRLHVCERTNLLLVEFNAISCSSRSTMEAGPWTGQGYSAPWMYHSVAGQYTLLEKQLVSDFSCPCRRRPGPRVLQDSTNWHDAPLPARWGPLRQEGHWFPGKELSRTAPSPKAQRQCSPTYDGLRPVRRRELSWGASPTAKEGFGDLAGRAAAASCRWNQAAPGKSKADLLARAPPSYEDHMLLRLRAGEGPRKENWARPPPYVAPPAYEAPHRTVQPQQRACRREVRQSPAPAPQQCRERAGGSQAGPGRKAGPRHAKLPGGWGCLSGATTWAGARTPPESAEWLWRALPARDRSPQRQSHTLPRVSKRSKGAPAPRQALPDGAPQHALPAGWGFSHAAGRPGALGHGGKHSRGDPLPRCKGPSPARERAPAATPQRPAGGLFVIDATCVVIQAHYIPAPRTQRVRYLGQERAAEKAKAATAPCSPARVSMEERAARILGLPLGDLGFVQRAGKAPVPEIPGHRLGEGCSAGVAVPAGAHGVGQPGGLPSPRHSPRKPPLAPTPTSFQVGPTELGGCPDGRGAPIPCQGCPAQSEEEPLVSVPGRSYVWDLKEAMSRIRRHTAPDSDTDEELEGEPAWGQTKAWRGHLNEGTLPYSSSSSSSSLESSGSNTTVVPGNATPTLRKGPQSDSELTLGIGDKAGQAVP